MAYIDNTVINSITVDDFKELFFRDFSFLPLWLDEEIYNTNDEVYYETTKLFYKALKDGVESVPTTTADWEKFDDILLNYVLDADIEKAFNEAACVVNTTLYANDDILKLAYLYLSAHYLCLDVRTAQAGLESNGEALVSSRSVGSVSESYVIPERYLKSPILSYYTKTGYGLKYLSLTTPSLTGNVFSVEGATQA